jgi:lipopolysaccharide transport system ATP-binding protein
MSSNNIAICVQNLGKRYQIYERPQDRLKQSIYPRLQKMIGRAPKNYCRDFWALNDVSFKVKKGETVGIIGRNGSGKSTLLQLICGTLTPSAGSVETKGRVTALLELGSGFNPEFTGRENVYMNGSILGLTHNETAARFDSITAFADIGEFIEQPVKTYSSGMLVRLAFAVSVCVEPDILIVDEALAVGDMNFQAKCMTALSRIQEKGTTILFVSHDIGSVKSLCSICVYLEHGKPKMIGPAPEVAEHYVRTMREELNNEYRQFSRETQPFPSSGEKVAISDEIPNTCAMKKSVDFDHRVAPFRYGSGGARITYVELTDTDDSLIDHIEFNQEIKIHIYFESQSEKNISVNFQILDDKLINITASGLAAAGSELLNIQTGSSYCATYTLRLPLQEGFYSIQATIVEPHAHQVRPDYLDVTPNAVNFRVLKNSVFTVWSKVHLFPTVAIIKTC